MIRYIFLLICLAASQVVGAEISGPDQVDQYKIVKLSAPTGFDSIIWDYPDAVSAEEEGLSLFLTAAPGTYEVKAFAVKSESGKFVLQKFKKKIVIKGQGSPNPQPAPGPVAHLIIVEESSQRTPELAKAFTSQAVRQALKSKNIQFHLLDKDQAPEYARLATALPQGFAIGADERVKEVIVSITEKSLLDWISKQ